MTPDGLDQVESTYQVLSNLHFACFPESPATVPASVGLMPTV